MVASCGVRTIWIARLMLRPRHNPPTIMDMRTQIADPYVPIVIALIDLMEKCVVTAGTGTLGRAPASIGRSPARPAPPRTGAMPGFPDLRQIS